jgi:hypothetical protein
MSGISYEDLLDIRHRLDAHQTTIEQEAQRYTLAELGEALRMTRGMLQAIVDGWTQEQLLVQPPGATDEGADGDQDRWSATQAITHLIATQNWYLLHMNKLLGRSERFDVMPRGLGDQARSDVPQQVLAADLRSATERLLSYIQSIPPDADLTSARSSTFFGDLSLRGWVMLAIGHDLDHLAQIHRLSELPGFPTSAA